MAILVAGHIGVRKREQREEDFRRANGLRIFIAAVIYFATIVGAIILLVNYLAA